MSEVNWQPIGDVQPGERLELGFECVRVLRVYPPASYRSVRVLGRDGKERNVVLSADARVRVVDPEAICVVDRYAEVEATENRFQS